ncbi:Kiwa anti-phage protein KwaB-like domain-containing protein [Peribacillus frigoritolerans]|uniref:Kiwa anti-phage protein KwaB-like domain-containing protein n=1 Tax=Peribacillus frigoritolerans TaxID=450367 RepID=UPI00399F1E45
MDIVNLVNILNGLNDQDLDMRLYFTRKRPNRRYHSYSPTIHPDLQIEIKDIVKSAVERVQEVEQRPFSPIGTIEGCIETYTPNEVTSFNDILESLNEDFVNRQEVPPEEVGKLTFYCLKIITDEGDILFFRRVTKFNRLKGGFFGKFTNGDFQKLDDTLLGIDPNVDIVIFGEEMLIFNHISLERIFSIQDQYHEKANQTLDLVNRTNRITNFEQFREDCLSDGRVTRALTKLLNEENRMHQVFENFENVIQVIDIFGLNIELEDENTRLVYEDKTQMLDITRLMGDSFYRTWINNRDGFDEGV